MGRQKGPLRRPAGSVPQTTPPHGRDMALTVRLTSFATNMVPAGDIWTPSSIIDSVELWVFWISVIFFGSYAHQLRRVDSHPLRRSTMGRWLSLHTLSMPRVPKGITMIDLRIVNEQAFWRRVYVVQWVFIILGALGVWVTAWTCPNNSTLFLPFLLQVIWVYSAYNPGSISLDVRWRTIYSVFFITLFFVVCELFRGAFGYHLTTGHWINIALLTTICGLAGTAPGMPHYEVFGGKVVEIANREQEQDERDEEALSTNVMQVAPCEAMNNSMIGVLFFTHVFTLIKTVWRYGKLGSLDVPVLGPELQAETLAMNMQQHLQLEQPKICSSHSGYQDELGEDEESNECTPLLRDSSHSSESTIVSPHARRLIFSFVRANAFQFLILFILTAVSVVTYYAPAFFANRIFRVLESDIASTETPAQTLKRALPWVLGLFITIITSSTLQGTLWSLMEGSLTVRLTTQLSMLLFNKTMNLAPAGHSSSTGQVFTLQLMDVDRIVSATFHLCALLTSPLELILGGYFLYRVLGISALIGLSTSIFIIPLVALLCRALRTSNARLMDARDKRMSLLSECFLGIRMIKAQAWESIFDERVGKTRKDELHAQKTTFVFETLMSSILEVNPLLLTFVALTCYTQVFHQVLMPSVAFTALALFTELRWVFLLLPRATISLLQTFVSADRIATYLLNPEVAPSPISCILVKPEACTLRLVNATLTWPTKDKAPFTLRDVNATFSPGITLVCGRVGAGKSLLLHGLLQEARILAGYVDCPRSPRSGVPYDAQSKTAALQTLNTPQWLRSDLVAYAPQVPFLLHTTIRENILFGLPMGDGKRYQATLEACGLGPDLQDLKHGDLTDVGENGTELSGGQKARIGLARAVYSRARVLLLDDVFAAVDARTCQHIITRLLRSGSFLDGRTVVLVSHNVQQVCQAVDCVVYLDNGGVSFYGKPQDFLESDHFAGWQQDREEDTHEETPPPPHLATQGTKRTAEHREKGGISGRVWLAYIHACSGWSLSLLTMLLFALTNLWDLVTNMWLRDWSASEGRTHTNAWWLSRYGGLLAIGIFFGVLRWIGIYTMSLRASRKLFDQMIWRTLHAPLHFFDIMTRGRLLNRFGQDLEVLDTKFATAISEVAIRVTKLLATAIALYMVGGTGFVLALLALLPVYAGMAHVYMIMARDLQRLNATSRSLVMATLTHVVHGVHVIRAFGAQDHFEIEMMGTLDNYNRFVWWAAQGGRWISQMFNLTSSFLVLISCFIVLLQPNTEPASIEFSLTFLIDLNFVLLILMRMYTQLQVSAVAVERVFEFTDSIEQEASATTETRPPNDWPQKGHIVVQDLVLRYSPDAPDVLKEISFDVPPGAKIAIVGPTGSGKSSLFQALQRLVEPRSGRIIIDGQDLSKVDLHDLRSRLYFVPQDPVILSGTLRSVLDVMNEFTDEEIYASLRAVRLVADDRTSFTNLDMPIGENGNNLSLGERQLLCVARALLHKSRVVLFDEASSSIDHTTDSLLTQCIHDVFKDSTVLTIAHRLRTVIGYDRILFLHQGRIVETGTPAALLSDTTSHFYRLCKMTGSSELQHLIKEAQQTAQRHD